MSENRYNVGDIVQFPWGTRMIQGVIREDRGPLGIGGRHLYGIEFHVDFEEEPTRYVELPAVDFELVEEPASTK